VPAWVIDLDGVMWRGREPIEGSVAAVAHLLERGDRVVFCTNNSVESGAARAARLRGQGVPDGAEVVTSADAVTALLQPGERVLCLGGPGLRSAIEGVGARVRGAGDGAGGAEPVDTVVVGLTREVDYAQIDRAAAAVRDGARFLASNADATFPGAGGLHPGCGAIVAAIEVASGARAEVAGKPHAPMAELLRRRLPDGAVVVGDRPDTDGRLAAALGWPFALVLSGVTGPGDLPVDVPCDLVADRLATVVAELAGRPPDRR
jgi:4-nitrophenyl phosphatase